jgi:hypothetical protein
MLKTLDDLVRLFGKPGNVLAIGPEPTGIYGDIESQFRYLSSVGLTRPGLEAALRSWVENAMPHSDAGPCLVILDRIWDSQATADAMRQSWRTRRAFYRELQDHLTADCELILLGADAAYLRSVKRLFATLWRMLRGTRLGMSFPGRYAAELRAEGFGRIRGFYIYHALENCNTLVSFYRRSSRAFRFRIHGQDGRLPRNPRQWLIWLAIWLSAGKGMYPAVLIWARR